MSLANSYALRLAKITRTTPDPPGGTIVRDAAGEPTGILKEAIPNSGGQWGLTQDDDGRTWNIDAGGEQGPVNFQIPIQYGSFNIPDADAIPTLTPDPEAAQMFARLGATVVGGTGYQYGETEIIEP